MNLLPSNCNKCGTSVSVSQAEWSDPDAHVCVHCFMDYQNELDEEELLYDIQNMGSWSTGDVELPEEEEEEESNPEKDALFPWHKKKSYLCECGKTKLNSQGAHSDWCPAYRRWK